jgi:hypothetical protein
MRCSRRARPTTPSPTTTGRSSSTASTWRLISAAADYNAALEIDPKKAASLYGRGMAKRRKGDFAEGNVDIAAARAIRPNIMTEYQGYGLMPPFVEAPQRGTEQQPDREDAQAKAQPPRARRN